MKCKKMAALVLGLLLSLGALAGCAGEPAMAEDSPSPLLRRILWTAEPLPKIASGRRMLR